MLPSKVQTVLPNPNTDATNAKMGKQQGESIAVRKSPAVPNLSILFFNFIFVLIMNPRVLLYLYYC